MSTAEQDNTEISRVSNPLESEEFLRQLVSEGRIPAFIGAFAGPKPESFVDGKAVYKKGAKGEKIVFCFVPPQGTQKGDAFRSVGGLTFVEVVSPSGESRGDAKCYTLTSDQASKVRERIIQITTNPIPTT